MPLKPNVSPRDIHTINVADHFTIFQKRGNRRSHCIKEKFDTLEQAMIAAEKTYNDHPNHGVMVYAVATHLLRDCMIGSFNHNGGELLF